MPTQTPLYSVVYLCGTNGLLSSESPTANILISDADSVSVGDSVYITYEGAVSPVAFPYLGSSASGGVFLQTGAYVTYFTNETGLNGTAIPEILAVDMLCFAAGTLIATLSGEVKVEDLKAGDLILTADGSTTPVKWLGRQTIATFFADEARVCPIRIAAGALAAGVPSRDLLVTGEHGIVFDEAIVVASALVNGTTITRVAKSDLETLVTYYHIETEGHAVILAEGTPAETFINNAGREKFDNFAEYVAMYGREQDDIEPLGLPRAKTAREVPAAIKALIAARVADVLGDLAQAN